ncbi:MAG: MBOAT family protein [Lachnospiraceae bacterium]|nr:MBOAT family protein [Lachnospiraceae bacterium]
MVFSSTVFLFVFFPLLMTIYYNPFFRGRSFRNTVLLAASLGFYAWGEPVFVFLMIFFIILTWFLGLVIDKSEKHKKAWLILGISLQASMLFIFKYLSFITSQFGKVFHDERMIIDIALPIGISFFTFQLMSYLFDIYYKKTEVQKNLLNLGLYVSFFPQLIAGPIVRYKQIASEIKDRKESVNDLAAGMKRFIYGLSKKVLIANYVGQIADNTFDHLGSRSVMMAWLGAICYTLQIYYDFSGYSDMAIGLGRIFGFHIAENFNYPYISKSVTEFWRRWHISLSSWFRDYVYIPLGGNRVNKGRWIRNLFIVWLLTGIWHGANWTFVCWGLFYFVILLAEKLTKTDKSAEKGCVRTLFSRIYTMIVIMIAWVIFRSDSMTSAIAYIGNMFGIGAAGLIDKAVSSYIEATAFVLVISVLGVTPLYSKAVDLLYKKKASWIESVWILILFVLALLQVISSTYNPFIYFNF